MMNQQYLEELCAAFALGSIETEELRELQQELNKQRPEQLDTLRGFLTAAQVLPITTEQIDPSNSVKDNVFGKIRHKEAWISPNTHRVNEVNKTAALSSTNSVTPSWIRLAAALLAGVALVLIYFTLNLNHERNELQQTVETRSALLQIAGIPITTFYKDYQLQVICDGTPLSTGVFNVVVEERLRFYPIDLFVEADLAGAYAIDVTLELSGGMPQAALDMYLPGTPES